MSDVKPCDRFCGNTDCYYGKCKKYDERMNECASSPLESVVQGRTESPVTLNPAVQGTPIIAILKDELKEWREGVKYMKEHKLDFRCELASAKALERAIQRIQREARS